MKRFALALSLFLLPAGASASPGAEKTVALTQADTIAVLPPAYRPAKAARVFPKGLGGAGNPWVVGVFNVDASGNISVLNVPAGMRGLMQWDDAALSTL